MRTVSSWFLTVSPRRRARNGGAWSRWDGGCRRDRTPPDRRRTFPRPPRRRDRSERLYGGRIRQGEFLVCIGEPTSSEMLFTRADRRSFSLERRQQSRVSVSACLRSVMSIEPLLSSLRSTWVGCSRGLCVGLVEDFALLLRKVCIVCLALSKRARRRSFSFNDAAGWESPGRLYS